MKAIWRHGAWLVLTAALLTGGCGPKLPAPTVSGEYRPALVRDMELFPQNLDWFAERAGNDVLLRSEAHAAEDAARFHTLLYAAWDITRPGRGNADFFRAELARSGSRRGYAENFQPWDESRWRTMATNADWPRFPSVRMAAITVRATSLRLAPTALPRFERPDAPGQGYPFDLFQQTGLPPGFPLMLLHRSRDGAWYYAENSLACGWVAADDVALVDQAFQRIWRVLPLAAFIRDGVSLWDQSGTWLARANLGTVLPLSRDDGSGLHVLVPVRDPEGRALIATARVNREQAAAMPLPLTPRRMAAVGATLMGQAYGWGGLNGDRDCSATLRDLFTPFGLWLPRNSASQAKSGRFVDLTADAPDVRERHILAEGRPFLTLLWMPGHIGLYLGECQGQAAFFHNLWGVRTRDANGREGRHVLGRAVITSTRPGRELPCVPDDALLLNRMKGMTLLGHD
ncbi:MAG: SH3 domain-containing protein [Desulfovibrionaceae bacterium]|nr:SH3 domain-containing protein [Desulfovibrionaceae bacterium]